MTKHWTALVTASLAALLGLIAPAGCPRRHLSVGVHQPGQSRTRGTAKCDARPDGAGANAAPGADVSYRNLTMAYLIGADLSAWLDIRLSKANLQYGYANATRT